jgi:hypothetical protein
MAIIIYIRTYSLSSTKVKEKDINPIRFEGKYYRAYCDEDVYESYNEPQEDLRNYTEVVQIKAEGEVEIPKDEQERIIREFGLYTKIKDGKLQGSRYRIIGEYTRPFEGEEE